MPDEAGQQYGRYDLTKSRMPCGLSGTGREDAFHARNMCVLNYGNGFTAWHYYGSLVAVSRPGFFAAFPAIQAFDTITVTGADGGATFMFREDCNIEKLS